MVVSRLTTVQVLVALGVLCCVFLAGFLTRQHGWQQPVPPNAAAAGAGRGVGESHRGGFWGAVPAEVVPVDLQRFKLKGVKPIQEQRLAPIKLVSQGDQPAKDTTATVAPAESNRSVEAPREKPADLCIGVPSAYREQSQLVQHMRELVDETKGESVHIILRQAYSARGNVDERKELEVMGIEVVTATEDYADLRKDDLRQNFGDSLTRVRWRAGHVLDYANTLDLCYQYGSPLILMIEDDLKPAKHVARKVFDKINQLPDKDFGFITLYSGRPGRDSVREVVPIKSTEDFWYGGPGQHGAVALVFRRDVATELVSFLRKEFIERPVDWLIPAFVGDMKKLRLYEFLPSLFQHMGIVSTFAENKDRRGMRSPSFRYN